MVRILVTDAINVTDSETCDQVYVIIVCSIDGTLQCHVRKFRVLYQII